jgi:hypothetical protein
MLYPVLLRPFTSSSSIEFHEENWSMIAYAFALILAVGIPFLLYCLWNFSRDQVLQVRLSLVFEFAASGCA